MMASGRSGTAKPAYRRSRAQILAESDMCWLCGHSGATTADHIIPEPDWPRETSGRMLPGFDDPANLRPAHGTMGNKNPPNPCPVCGQLCNQSRGRKPVLVAIRSRDW